MRKVLLMLVALLASAPLSTLLTLLLIPFWRWLEATQGIESIGHSGPAVWCYVVVFTGCVFMVGSGLLLARGRRQGEPA